MSDDSEAIKKLRFHLSLYYHGYGIDDVELSPVKGYLELRGENATINIKGVGYPRRDERGRFASPYRLWRELHDELPTTDTE